MALLFCGRTLDRSGEGHMWEVTRTQVIRFLIPIGVLKASQESDLIDH